MGSFLSEGEVECKVGYTVDIQFTLNKDDWFFDTLEAVSTADASESRQDYVQFTLNEKKSDKSKGVYVITVKLLKPAGDILIRPKCLALPYIKSYTPATKSAQFANTPVVINFSIPVEAKDTSKSQFNYDNIIVTFDQPGDMKDYFFPPEFNEDKTVLKLVPKGGKLREFISVDRKASFVDISFSFSDKIVVKNGEHEFPLRQDSNSTFTVRFGTESEETPPDERDFFVSGHEITLATVSELDDSKKLLLNKLSPDLTIAQCIQNMTPATMFIYGKYYDKDSGVRSIEVSEKYRGQFATNTAYYSNYDIVTTSYDLDSNNVEYISENGYTSFLFKYRIQGTLAETAGGGYFDLSVTIKDACGNPSETKSFAVLCMEYGDTRNFHEYTPKKNDFYQHGINVTNTVFSKAADGSSGNYDFSKYNSDLKTIVIKDDVNDNNEYKQSYFEIESRNYNEKKILLKDVKFVCEYIDRFGTKRREPFTDYNSETKQRSVVLDIDSVTGKTFTVIPLYDDIPLGRKTFKYPSIPPLATEIDSDHVRQTYDSSFECIGICLYPDGSSKIIFDADYVYLNKFPNNCKVYLARLDPNHTGYDNWPAILEKDEPYIDVDYDASASKDYIYYGLLGELIGPFEYGQESVPALPIPEIKDYEIVKSEKKGYVDVIIKFAADVWDSYDSMTIINDSQNKDYKFERKDTFVEGEYVCYKLPPIETKKFFSNPYTGKSQAITVSAMKGYVYVKRNTNVYTRVGLNPAQQTEFDDMEPADLSVKTFKLDKDKYGPFGYNNQLWYQSRQYVVFSFSDYGSGPKSGKMWLNGGSTVYEMTDAGKNSFEGQMPIYLFKWGENEISYRLEDNKGNVTEGTLICNTKNWGKSNAILTECPTYSSNKATLTYPSYFSSDETSDFQVFQFDGMSDSKYPLWVAKEISANDINTTNHTISVAVVSGKFYRVIYRNTDAVYYAGTITDTAGDYNYVNQNGSSEDSVVICSGDSKVLVTVCSVKDTMEECKEWNANQWKMMCRRRIENVFEVTPKVPKVYKVPEEYFSGGNNTVESKSYYCVIAHFANGDCIVGPVMHH